MTELNKLLTSLILLGGGFFAASLIGPPEVIDRLSRYLRPSGVDFSEGLRPLAVNSSGESAPWPASAPTAPAAPGSVGSGPVATNSVASVAAMVPPSSWPGEAPTPTVAPASPWGAAEFASSQSPSVPLPSASTELAPPSQDWLTSASLAAPSIPTAPSAPSSQALTPVPRSGVTATAVAAPIPDQQDPAPPAADGWPELRAPLPPMADQGFDATPPQEVTAAKPVVEASTYSAGPYEGRPSFDAASTGFDADRNPLRYDASVGQSFDPIERQPTAAGESFVQHIVTDGDTLPSLAKRYLGDAARAQELFEMNRDRLEHPDVLPIGMVLKAPKGRAAQPAAPTVSATTIGYPHLERPGNFSTVSATEAYLPPVATAQRRPLTPIRSEADRPLTEEQRLGPVDAIYQQDFSWDANGW